MATDPKKFNPMFAAAEIAFEAGRYDEAIRFASESVSRQPRLTKEQRVALSRGMHKAVSRARSAIRAMDVEIQLCEKRELSSLIARFQKMKIPFRDQITKIANAVVELVDVSLYRHADDVQTQVFYTKLKGDCNRYLAELNPGDEAYIGRARAAYETALRTVGDELRMADPIYLGLVLNFAVFQYEMLGLKDDAIDRLDSAFNEAVRYMEELDEQEYAEATMVLELLRDNIAIWREEKADDRETPINVARS